MNDRDPEQIRRQLADDGFSIIQNLFTTEEISRLRATCDEHFAGHGVISGLGQTQPNAAVDVPALEWVFTCPAVVQLYESVLGTGNVAFTNHADIHKNMLSGWHKDSGERYGGYFRGDYFSAPDCMVYKLGVYLQEHASNSAGLTVVAGSQRCSDRGSGQNYYAPTHLGDAILFDVRLSHIGQLPDIPEKVIWRISRFRGSPDGSDPFAYQLKRAYWAIAHKRAKYSVFFTFGACNSWTEDFAFANMWRQRHQTSDVNVEISPALHAALAQAGIRTYSFAELIASRDRKLWIQHLEQIAAGQ